MVRIVNYQKKTAENGSEFFTLELQGGIEMVKSKQSGKFYLTARKASILSTFDENVCQALIGTELPGVVKKVDCDPYEYTIKDTGEVVVLSHRYEYSESEEKQVQPQKSETTFDELLNYNPLNIALSMNGQHA